MDQAFLPTIPLRQLAIQKLSLQCKRKKFWTARQAVIGTVSSSLQKALLAPGITPEQISVAKASLQHQAYSHLLCTAPSITTMGQVGALPDYPDAVFVEDRAIAISPATAFMPQAGHPSREGEGLYLEEVLRKMGIHVLHGKTGRMDGGDVLRMAGCYVVGISTRTDEQGVCGLRDAIEITGGKERVFAVEVIGGLHLKSVVSWVGSMERGAEGFLVAARGAVGEGVVREIREKCGEKFEVVWIGEDESVGANVVFLGDEGGRGRVIMQGSCPGAVGMVREQLKNGLGRFNDVEVVTVDMSELAKANGALTCCSIIF